MARPGGKTRQRLGDQGPLIRCRGVEVHLLVLAGCCQRQVRKPILQPCQCFPVEASDVGRGPVHELPHLLRRVSVEAAPHGRRGIGHSPFHRPPVQGFDIWYV
jgi:hypothetical protein